MAFQDVTDLSCETVVSIGGVNKKSKRANPTSIEGFYIGSRDVESKLSPTGMSKLHIFQTPTGNTGVWGKTDLDNKLKTVAPGVLTRVTFTHKVPSKYGEMYKYRVQVDLNNVVDVSSALASTDMGATEADYSEEADATSEGEYEEAPMDEVQLNAPEQQQAAVPSAEKQAATRSLLNGTRRRAS